MSDELILSPNIILAQNKNAARIAGWLVTVLEGHAEHARSFELALHADDDGDQRLLRQIPLDGPPDPEKCAEIVRAVEASALDDAGQVPGTRQTYVLTATTDHGNAIGSLKLTYSSFVPGWANVGNTEPTERSFIQQLLQQNQELHVVLMQTVAPMAESASRRIAQQDGIIERAIERQSRFVDEKEELATKRLERDLALESARKRQDMDALQELAAMQKAEQFQKFVIDKITPAVPIIINRIAKGSGIPGTASPMDQMIETLATSLTKEELVGIAGVVRPEIGGLLREILTSRAATPLASPREPTPPAAAPSPTNAGPPEVAVADDAFGPLPPVAVSAAIEVVRKELLPWMESPLSAGKDIVTEKPMAIILLSRLMQSMTLGEYDTLTTSDPRLSPAERAAFAALITKLELAPWVKPGAIQN